MKTLVSYSAGTDSTVLAFHLQAEGHEVTLACFDDGPDNDPHDKCFDDERRPDMNPRLEELHWYQDYYARAYGFDTIRLRFPTYNSLTTQPKYLAPTLKDSTVFAEANGNKHYAGLKWLMLSTLLSYGASYGYNAVAFGHLPYNDQYRDSSPKILQEIRDFFATVYGDRVEVPILLEPWQGSEFGTKQSVIRRGLQLLVPLHMTYSCRRGQFVGPQVGWAHCGTCENCLERLRAFSELDLEDAAAYISRGDI